MPSIRRSLLILALTTLVAAPLALRAAAKQAKLVVPITTHDGLAAGSATITPHKDGIRIHISAKNLPVGDHAVHIHSIPRCDPPDFKSAGPHFNPTHKMHGYMNPNGPHMGDMPANLTIGESHTGEATFTLPLLSLESILANGGTSLVIHDHGDDQMTDPSGNSGNRIACAVISR